MRGFVASASLALLVGTVAGCGPSDPTPECSLVPTVPEPSVASRRESHPDPSCDRAVAAAKARLPFFHPRIVRIQFQYGDGGTALVADVSKSGHVIFSFDNGTRLAVDIQHLGETQLVVGSPQPIAVESSAP